MPKFNYLALGIGACFAISATFSGCRTLNYIGESSTASGVVIATPIGPHHPEVAFTDASGNRVHFLATGDITQNIGDNVQVRYRRAAPAHSARLDTFGSLWGTTLFLLAMTAAFVIAGLRNIALRGWGQEK